MERVDIMTKNDYGLTIYFVRHGETYLNFYNRMQGWANAPLTPRGEEGVRASGRGLADVCFDAVYTSDLTRTVDTAKLILEENKATDPKMPIIMMEEFREIFFGEFEGERVEEVYKKVANELGYKTTEKLFKNSNQLERMDIFKKLDEYGHAESFMEFWTRAEKGLTKLVDKHRDSGDTILLVAHGGTIRLILENLIPSLENPKGLLNASVSVAHYDNGLYHLDRYGDVSHFIENK